MDSERPYRPFGYNALGSPPQSPLAKLFAFLLSAAFLVLAFMFSLVALAVVAVLGLVLGGWLWWRTRQLRQQINRRQAEQWSGSEQENPFRAAASGSSSTVIDGEATRITDDATGSPTRRQEG